MVRTVLVLVASMAILGALAGEARAQCSGGSCPRPARLAPMFPAPVVLAPVPVVPVAPAPIWTRPTPVAPVSPVLVRRRSIFRLRILAR